MPSGISEYFLPNNLTLAEALRSAGPEFQHAGGSQGLVYHPVLLAQARTLFLNRKYDLDYELPQAVIVATPDKRGVVRWENFPASPIDPRKLEDKPAPQARFTTLDVPLSDAKVLNALQRDFADWAFREAKVTVHANEELKVYGGPEVSQGEFRQLCAQAARDQHEAEVEKVADRFTAKLKSLQDKLEREERELDQDQSRLSSRRLDEIGSAAETVFSLFGGRKSSRRISSSLTKRRMTADASADVKESKEAIADLQAQIADLEKEKAQAIAEVDKRWGDIASQCDEITIPALKKDVNVELFGVAWFPYYIVQAGGQPATARVAGPATRQRTMKTLLVLRHAKSSWKEDSLPDRERPLNKRGQEDAPKMGALLRKQDLLPDLVLSSPALRARSTAELVIEESGYDGEVEFREDALFLRMPSLT